MKNARISTVFMWRRKSRWPVINTRRSYLSLAAVTNRFIDVLNERTLTFTNRTLSRRYLQTSPLVDPDAQHYRFSQFRDGPPLQLGLPPFGQHASASIVGLSGSTVVTTTVCTESSPNNTFLTVDVRLRDHGVGRIPSNRFKRDYAIMNPAEVLASRAVDRAIRPLLLDTISGKHYHVHAAVQSVELVHHPSGHPVAVAINTVSAALYEHLSEPVAATSLCVMEDGAIILQDPSPYQIKESLGELLIAGTRDKIVMMEYTSHNGKTGLAEEQWQGLLEVAMAALRPLLDTVEQLQTVKAAQSREANVDVHMADIRMGLGLDDMVALTEEERQKVHEQEGQTLSMEDTEQFITEAVHHCTSRLRDPLCRLFGHTQDAEKCTALEADIHRESNLLSKSLRGTRETVIRHEIVRVFEEYLQQATYTLNEEIIYHIREKVVDKVFREALWNAVSLSGARSDGRGVNGKGWKSVRPVRVQVPVLPDAVHGSALFARGETQVLCTVTLGAPSEGLPRSDPFQSDEQKLTGKDDEPKSNSAFKNLPVGSLRFLRSQEALVSDLNSTKVQADREPLGTSGNLADLKRTFLQYDFPNYSTGKVPDTSQAAKRRSIGHGSLAERAILPVLPSADDFPYSIRMTSEVTDSNGSSSMAAVCGMTMALLDAGVPLSSPVAGVSVGAAASGDAYALMLDITGTEDYYGAMDLKVAGTVVGVTALQMDTKLPLPLNAVVEALYLAREGRQTLLQEMGSQSTSLPQLQPRPEFKYSAPCVEVVRFDPQRKRDAVGPGGVVLRQLEDRYGVSLDLTQEGKCLIFGHERDMVQKAKTTIMDLVSDVVVGDTYKGTVIEIKDFGAIVELLRNKEGILHVSELSDTHDPSSHPKGIAGFINDFLRLGQEVEATVIGIDPVQSSIKLSMRESRKNYSSY